ncbi:MAG: hypothetical protein U0003_03650 [Vampirovibrionales bacterium]
MLNISHRPNLTTPRFASVYFHARLGSFVVTLDEAWNHYQRVANDKTTEGTLQVLPEEVDEFKQVYETAALF